MEEKKEVETGNPSADGSWEEINADRGADAQY